MLWVQAFHIIAVICWFAGIFYLPRLFVYHASAEDSISIDRFKIMERKLFRGIMTPAAVISVILGLIMLIPNWAFYKTEGWMHAKLTLVILLLGFHGACYRHLKIFQRDENQKSERYFRWFNELPTFLLVGIIILVIVRPF